MALDNLQVALGGRNFERAKRVCLSSLHFAYLAQVLIPYKPATQTAEG
jgi:hypothetical protein